MTEDLISLARRAVACKGWRWMPGMRTTDGMRVIHDPYRWPAVPRPLGDHLPDLTDPATLGCLLALVREAWDARWVCTTPEYCSEDGQDTWRVDGIEARAYGPTEAEALVAALEKAPCP